VRAALAVRSSRRARAAQRPQSQARPQQQFKASTPEFGGVAFSELATTLLGIVRMDARGRWGIVVSPSARVDAVPRMKACSPSTNE